MKTRTMYTGTVEYLAATLTSEDGITLAAQPVYFSFDRTTWLQGEWTGAVATTRVARVLLDGSKLPTPGQYPVYVRVTDNPEAPVTLAGSLNVI